MHHKHPSQEHLLGALLEQGAADDWADKVSQAYGSALLQGDDQRTTLLQLRLSSLFREKGFDQAALAILARPSVHTTYEQTGRAHGTSTEQGR